MATKKTHWWIRFTICKWARRVVAAYDSEGTVLPSRPATVTTIKLAFPPSQYTERPMVRGLWSPRKIARLFSKTIDDGVAYRNGCGRGRRRRITHMYGTRPS